MTSMRSGPERRFRAVIWWKDGIMSFAELESLRRLSPEAKAIPAVEIWNRSKTDGWELGEFMEGQLDALWEQARELHLGLDFVLVSEPEPEVQRVRVFVVWKAKSPSPAEIIAWRKLSEEAAGMTASEILKKAREGEWMLGSFWPNRLPELERKAAELGLQLRRLS